jgi:hypothetical protein
VHASKHKLVGASPIWRIFAVTWVLLFVPKEREDYKIAEAPLWTQA